MSRVKTDDEYYASMSKYLSQFDEPHYAEEVYSAVQDWYNEEEWVDQPSYWELSVLCGFADKRMKEHGYAHLLEEDN